ncbi:MAG: glycoside hydrolase family 127 protein [Bacteroidota bacterium]
MLKFISTACLVWLTIAVNAQDHTLQRFPLTEVRLLKSPFLDAEQTDMNYMLKLDPDRLLAPFLREAGLVPKAASYGNWENTGLDGHIGGHYLTAVAQMYAATGDKKWKARLDYMIGELKRCQDNRSDGYVGGVPGGPQMWQQLKGGDFSLFRKKWVPWYNLHKLYAGLRDAYLIGGNQDAKSILIKLSNWASNEVSGLSEEQMQLMLSTEHGGMNEVFADVAAITRDDKYLVLAKRFSHKAILQPLEMKQDKLNGLHANTNIPKVIGFERIAQLNHDPQYDAAAQFFWTTVVNNRSIAIGGNSVREHFNPSDDFSSMLESEQGPETCNSYNMLKLSELLFLSHPNGKYMDYYERTLYNHILSSQHPGKEGGFVYFTPIRPSHYRVYSQPEQGFWCCVGSGMENHGKYGEMIYAHRDNDLYVNLFIPSTLQWGAKGVTVTQSNLFPFEERSELRLTLTRSHAFKLLIRQPEWVKQGQFSLTVNGKKINAVKDTDAYVSITRKWSTGDKIVISMPMTDRLEYLPDHSAWAAIVHGPIVLSAATDSANLKGLKADDSRFGHIAGGSLYPMNQAPLLVRKEGDVSADLLPIKNAPLTFQVANMIYQPAYKNLVLKPFFEMHDARYMLYWPVAKPGKEEQRELELTQNDRMVMSLNQRTVDGVSPGEQQPETDHVMDAENSKSGLIKDRHFRSADGFFSYKMKMSTAVQTLQVTYYGLNKGREFDILLNDQRIAHVVLDGSRGDRFFTQEYQVPAAFKSIKEVTVKFSAAKPSSTADIFDVRLVK